MKTYQNKHENKTFFQVRMKLGLTVLVMLGLICSTFSIPLPNFGSHLHKIRDTLQSIHEVRSALRRSIDKREGDTLTPFLLSSFLLSCNRIAGKDHHMPSCTFPIVVEVLILTHSISTEVLKKIQNLLLFEKLYTFSCC